MVSDRAAYFGSKLCLHNSRESTTRPLQHDFSENEQVSEDTKTSHKEDSRQGGCNEVVRVPE